MPFGHLRNFAQFHWRARPTAADGLIIRFLKRRLEEKDREIRGNNGEIRNGENLDEVDEEENAEDGGDGEGNDEEGVEGNDENKNQDGDENRDQDGDENRDGQDNNNNNRVVEDPVIDEDVMGNQAEEKTPIVRQSISADHEFNGIPCPAEGASEEAVGIIARCAICQTNQIQTVNFPCMHACFCLMCIRPSISVSKICPICRTEYIMVSMLYLHYTTV